MAAFQKCRVSQKQHPPMGHSSFLEIAWAESTETLAVSPGTSNLVEGQAWHLVTGLLSWSISHADHIPMGRACFWCTAVPERGTVEQGLSIHVCSLTDVPWASFHFVGLPNFLPHWCWVPAGHAHLDVCHADSQNAAGNP